MGVFGIQRVEGQPIDDPEIVILEAREWNISLSYRLFEPVFLAQRSSQSFSLADLQERREVLLGSDCCNVRLQKVMTQTNRDAAGFHDELSQPMMPFQARPKTELSTDHRLVAHSRLSLRESSVRFAFFRGEADIFYIRCLRIQEMALKSVHEY